MKTPAVWLVCICVVAGCGHKRPLVQGSPEQPSELSTNNRAYPEEHDILDAALKGPRFRQRRRQKDGETVFAKYGDFRLEGAAEVLADIERPWTVTKMLRTYKKETDSQRRAHMLRVLAASRDPRAALVLGEELTSPSLHVRVVATYGILDYYKDGLVGGGTEQHMQAAQDWWKDNEHRLRSEAAVGKERE